MQKAISVSHLVKEYGRTKAVAGISFDVPAGSIFAFLGTNGAGKTTTIGCLTTITKVTSGKVQIHGYELGQDDDAIRRHIGVVFQESLLDPLLTVYENLHSRALFYGLGAKADARIQELSALIDLGVILNKRYSTLSGGQKRRTDIARALIHSPAILFLDEPTAGLDPQSREKVWKTIYGLQASMGLTVFLTTHYMEETERADSVYVIKAGKVIANGTPTSLRAQYSQDVLRIGTKDAPLLTKILKSEKYAFDVKDSEFSIRVASSQAALAFLKQHEKLVDDFEFRHGTMDNVFLELTADSHAKETL